MIEVLETWVAANRMEEADDIALSFVIRGAIVPARFVHDAHKVCQIIESATLSQ